MAELKPLHPLASEKTAVLDIKKISLAANPAGETTASSNLTNAPKANPVESKSETRSIQFKFRAPKWLLIPIGAIVLLLVLGTLAAALAYKTVVPPFRATAQSAKTAVASLQAKNLVEAKAKLAETKDNLAASRRGYAKLGFLNLIPFVRNYYQDGSAGLEAADSALQAGDMLVVAIEPYADILGLQADSQNKVQADSAEDRIVFVVQTLDAIAPKLDEISAKLNEANQALKRINSNRYPEEISGTKIRSNIILAQNSLNSAVESLSQAKPLIALLPELLGQNEEKIYMLLFQNNGEIRPTGGFMTAYAYIKVSKGKITPMDSYNIYDLDARWGRKLPAPEPIKKYLPLVNNWNLRDMNLSPDLKVSMDTFSENYRDIPNVQRFDGIIVMDTELPVEILKIIGPIGVGGWGNFSAENDPHCDCPQVVYALETIISKPTYAIREDRKAVLGPLMHSLLANAMGSPKALWPQLLNAGIAAIQQKHLMFYFPNEKNQKLAEAMNAAGRIVEFDGDYLHINDSNFGGAKGDLFINRKVEEEIELSADGKVNKTVSITYDNPFPASNCNLEAGQLCLNGVYRDWVRLYVPKGAVLESVVGSEVEEQTGEDLGKTVFEAFFTMRPQSSSKLVFEYSLPGTYTAPYSYLIQKQPGKDTITHEILFNGKPYVFEIAGDTQVKL